MLTYVSVPYLLVHAVFILSGYICFVKALEYLPLGLVGLIESSNLFLTLFIDSFVGYIKITPYFVIMFAVFIFSIFLFCKDCSNKDSSYFKRIEHQGFVWILSSVLFYVTAPYLIKISDNLGANEIAITLSYYILALPYFAYKVFSNRSEQVSKSKNWWNSLFFLGLIIGLLESVYFVLETFSFINDVPTVVMIIAQMRIFWCFCFQCCLKWISLLLKKLLRLF